MAAIDAIVNAEVAARSSRLGILQVAVVGNLAVDVAGGAVVVVDVGFHGALRARQKVTDSAMGE